MRCTLSGGPSSNCQWCDRQLSANGFVKHRFSPNSSRHICTFRHPQELLAFTRSYRIYDEIANAGVDAARARQRACSFDLIVAAREVKPLEDDLRTCAGRESQKETLTHHDARERNFGDDSTRLRPVEVMVMRRPSL